MNVWVIDMKKYILGFCAFICTSALAQEVVVMSPDTHLKVNIVVKNGSPFYSVNYKNPLAELIH